MIEAFFLQFCCWEANRSWQKYKVQFDYLIVSSPYLWRFVVRSRLCTKSSNKLPGTTAELMLKAWYEDALELAETNSLKNQCFEPYQSCQAFLKRTPKSPRFFKWSLTQTWSPLSIDHLRPGFPPLHPWPVANRHSGAGSIVPADHHATWVWTDSKSLACRFESGLRGVYWACLQRQFIVSVSVVKCDKWPYNAYIHVHVISKEGCIAGNHEILWNPFFWWFFS